MKKLVIVALLLMLFANYSFSKLRADLNNDGIVNNGDFAILASEWMLEEDILADNFLTIGNTGQYITIADANNLDFGTGDFSYCFWFYRNFNDEDFYIRNVFSKGVNLSIYFESGVFAVNLWKLSAMWDYRCSTADFPFKTWTHVTITKDANGIYLYLDAQLVNSFVMNTKNGTPNITNSSPLIISPSSPSVNSLFDDIRIYNKTLNITEIGTIYGGGTGKKYSVNDAGTAVWASNCDSSTGNYLVDIVNGNNGVLTGNVSNNMWNYGGTPFPSAENDDRWMSLNSDSRYVFVPSSSAINFGTGDFSIHFVIKTTGAANVLQKRTFGTDLPDYANWFGYMIYIVGSGSFGNPADYGKIIFTINDGTNSTSLMTNQRINDGIHHFVSITVDRSSKVRCYIDNILDIEVDNITINNIDNSESLVLGNSGFGPSVSFNIDDIRFYKDYLVEGNSISGLLTNDEIYEICNSNQGKKYGTLVTSPNKVASWASNCDSNSGNILIDEVNNRNGLLMGNVNNIIWQAGGIPFGVTITKRMNIATDYFVGDGTVDNILNLGNIDGAY